MSRDLAGALVAEVGGTFLFFVVGAGSAVVTEATGGAGTGLIGIALAHGLVLTVLVSGLGAVSGALPSADLARAPATPAG